LKNLINKTAKICLSLSAILLFLGTVQAQIFTGSGFTVVDGGGRVAASCSTVPVTGVTGSRNVRSVSFTGTHTWLGDTEIRVYPPGALPPPSVAAPTVVISSPPDGRSCNYNGTYRFIDTAAQSIDAATAGCADASNIAPGDYRASTYGGGTTNGPVASLTTSFGMMTPAQINGNWLVCMFDFVATDGGTVTSTSIQFAAPTAAGSSISGRVVDSGGNGISGAVLTVTDSTGTPRTARTNSFGYYRLNDLPSGQTYILTITSRRHQFENPERVINLIDNIADFDFVALPD
jgi:hypothetical protein